MCLTAVGGGVQDAAAAKADEDAKLKADTEAGEDDEEESLAAKLVAKVHSLFEHPSLASLKATAQPLLNLLEDNEMLVFAVLGAPLLLLLLPLLSLLGGKVCTLPTPLHPLPNEQMAIMHD